MQEEDIVAPIFESVEDYEREARKHLSPEVMNYIYYGTESEATLRRNFEGFAKFQLRRRVLTGISKASTKVSYFDGRVESDLPFFPSCINTSLLHENALLDILSASKIYAVPIFVSEFSVTPPLEFTKLPSLADSKASLFWQIYLQNGKIEQSLKQAGKAKELGYRGVVVTVDAELNVKLRNAVPSKLMQDFATVTPHEIRRLRDCTPLPFVVKGVMTGEDAITAVESGADGVVVSNHGGRVLDQGQSTIEVLPEIVGALRSRKSTRKTEIFFDGGIRRGTDILKALALGARGCLLGRPIFWAMISDRKNGVANVLGVLEKELTRSAILCGVADLAQVPGTTVIKGGT